MWLEHHVVFQLDHRPTDLVALWRGALEHTLMPEHVCVCAPMYACVTVHRWCLKDKCDVDWVSFFISQWGYGRIFPTDTPKSPSAVSLPHPLSHTHTHTHTQTHKHILYRHPQTQRRSWFTSDLRSLFTRIMKHCKPSHTRLCKFSNIMWHRHLQIKGQMFLERNPIWSRDFISCSSRWAKLLIQWPGANVSCVILNCSFLRCQFIRYT